MWKGLGRGGGVRARIGLAFSMLALAVFGAIAALSAWEARRQSEREALAALQQVADRLAQRMDADMAARFRDVEQLAQLTSLLAPDLPAAQWRPVLEALRDSSQHYSWIGVADAHGTVLAATGKWLEGRDVSQRPWFQQGQHRTVVGDVHEAKLLATMLPALASGEPLRFVDVAAPLKRHGERVGVIGAHLSWQWAEERRRQALAAVAGRHSGVEILLADRQGLIELGPKLPALPQGPDGKPTLPHAGSELLAWSDGRRYLSAISASKPLAEYPGMGWMVLVRQAQEPALAAATALQGRLLLLGGLGVLAFGLGGWVLADRLTRPLRRVALQAQAMMQQDHAPPVPDEVDQLAITLGSLLQGLQRRESELRALNEGLEARVQERTALLQQVNEDLRSFSRSVSHDLQAPLGMVSLLLARLMEGERMLLSPKATRTIEMVVQECDRLAALTRELLTLAMVEDRPLLGQWVDQAELVQEVVAQLRAPDAGAQHAVFDVGDLPQVWGDALLLRQVWVNLLSNAMKFSAHSERPRVTVRAVQSGSETVFEVADNGVGFDATQAQRLFGVFQRLHASAQFPGTGVGLSIVRRVVHRHGGRVWASAQPGAGARFCFALPREPGLGRAMTGAAHAQPEGESAPGALPLSLAPRRPLKPAAAPDCPRPAALRPPVG